MSGTKSVFENKMRDKEFQRLFAQEDLRLGIAQRIYELMKEQGMKQKELAKRLEISEGRVSQLLSGNANMTLRVVSDMFFALGKRMAWRDEDWKTGRTARQRAERLEGLHRIRGESALEPFTIPFARQFEPKVERFRVRVSESQAG